MSLIEKLPRPCPDIRRPGGQEVHPECVGQVGGDGGDRDDAGPGGPLRGLLPGVHDLHRLHRATSGREAAETGARQLPVQPLDL